MATNSHEKAILDRVRGDAPSPRSQLAHHFNPPTDYANLIAHSSIKASTLMPPRIRTPANLNMPRLAHPPMPIEQMEAARPRHLPGALPLGRARPESPRSINGEGLRF